MPLGVKNHHFIEKKEKGHSIHGGSIKQGSPLKEVPRVSIEIQSPEGHVEASLKQQLAVKEQKDQDTEPKDIQGNQSGSVVVEQIEDHASNFSLDSIPSENNKNDDTKDVKLRGHTTGRMPVRNLIANQGSGISNYKWTH